MQVALMIPCNRARTTQMIAKLNLELFKSTIPTGRCSFPKWPTVQCAQNIPENWAAPHASMISALAAEIARSGKQIRALLTEDIRNAFKFIADLNSGKDE